ncbi:hypothetical protein THAOC_15811 [Thalassiosira oceanica]|uniref:Cyclin N-terminal domain-containing protein n=1 Tax=Thalassiosira oceanica TaxID=159749 RepID=K0SZ57_THAOC|nr:hypothetical protein THAOC_15811 [Thalassiosira oceanica]|eukprot:EJK63527.1 hypothetical protein THAOC_15811 [Thalassiosira oceanica]
MERVRRLTFSPYRFADSCKMKRETMVVAIDICDRFLGSVSTSSRHHFLGSKVWYQLLVTTSVYIAIKTAEDTVCDSQFIADLSRGLYSKESVERTELDILTALDWHVNVPTSIQFVYIVLSIVRHQVHLPDSTWAPFINEVSIQVENGLKDYQLAIMPSSILALDALLNVTSRQECHIKHSLLPALVRVGREQFLMCPQSQGLGVGLLRLQDTLGNDNDVPFLMQCPEVAGCYYEEENNKKKIFARGVNESHTCIRQFSDAELGL